MPVDLPGDRPNRTAAAVLSSFRFAAYRWLWLSNLAGSAGRWALVLVLSTQLLQITHSVQEQEAGLEGAILKPPGQVPSLLGHPLAGRNGGDAGEMDLAAGDLEPGKETALPPPPPLRVKSTTGEVPNQLGPFSICRFPNPPCWFPSNGLSSGHVLERDSHRAFGWRPAPLRPSALRIPRFAGHPDLWR